MGETTGFIAFYITFIVLIGIVGYYAEDALGIEGYQVSAPTLTLPEQAPPADFGEGTGWDIFEFITNFLSWLGYIIVLLVAGAIFGIELLVYLVGLQGLVGLGLPALWSGAIGTILLTILFFVLVKTWKGG